MKYLVKNWWVAGWYAAIFLVMILAMLLGSEGYKDAAWLVAGVGVIVIMMVYIILYVIFDPTAIWPQPKWFRRLTDKLRPRLTGGHDGQ